MATPSIKNTIELRRLQRQLLNLSKKQKGLIEKQKENQREIDSLEYLKKVTKAS